MDGASRSYVSPERVHYNVDGGTVKAGSEQSYCISGQHDSMTSRGHVLERGGPLQVSERTTALIPEPFARCGNLAKGSMRSRASGMEPWKPGRLRNRAFVVEQKNCARPVVRVVVLWRRNHLCRPSMWGT